MTTGIYSNRSELLDDRVAAAPLWSLVWPGGHKVTAAELRTTGNVAHYAIDELGATGRPRMQDAQEIASDKLLVQTGDLLVSRLNPRRGHVFEVARHDVPAVASTEFAVLRCDASVDSRYVRYAVTAGFARQHLDSHVRSSTKSHGRVEFQYLWNQLLPAPHVEAQRRIADYLDTETARIQVLVTKNQEARSFLAEREVAAVGQLVGDAGLAGQGRNEVGNLRWFDCEIQTGPFGSQLHAEDYEPGGHPVINPSNIVSGRLVANDDVAIGEVARDRLARHVLSAGDVVFGRRGEMGRAAVVEPHQEGWVCGTGCLRVRFRRPRFRPDYLHEVLGSQGVRAWFDMMAVGSTMANLNEDLLGSLPVPAISLEHQDFVMERIRDLRSDHDAIRGRLERQSDLLVERRAALITAVVAGELEV